jgi:uncharacterized protein (DUF433 family)
MNESSDVKICYGKQGIGGTRIPVTRVVGSLAANEFEDVQREYYLGIKDVLEETERRFESGEATFSDWEKAKISGSDRLKL